MAQHAIKRKRPLNLNHPLLFYSIKNNPQLDFIINKNNIFRQVSCQFRIIHLDLGQ